MNSMRLTRRKNLGLLLIAAVSLTTISTFLFYHKTNDYHLWKLQKRILSRIGFDEMYKAFETRYTNTKETKEEEKEVNVVEKLQQELPHLPVSYLSLTRNSARSYNKTCATLPTLFDLNVNNVYWQHLVTKGSRNFYLYGAYYDEREFAEGRNRIRILGMVDQIPPPTTFCQFWYEDENRPKFSPNASVHHHIWINGWGNGRNGTLHPVLISCALPKKERNIPIVVSLVETVCDDAKNALNIFDEPPPPENSEDNSEKNATIAVCVKGLNYLYEDRSTRLVEWFELLRILGAEKVFMYAMSVHPNILKVLNYYQNDGLVDYRNLTLPGDQVNQDDLRIMYLLNKLVHKRQNEVIPYNDCLYRSINRYDYVLLLDTDEVIVPTMVDDWQQLIRNIVYNETHVNGSSTQSKHSSLCAVSAHFYDDYLDSDPTETFTEIPKYQHMLNHVHRMADFGKPGMGTKCFHATSRVLTLHNHYPMSCGSKGCRSKNIPTEEGRMHHYRNRNRTGQPNRFYQVYLNNTVTDKTIWKYKDRLIPRSNLVLYNLGRKRIPRTPLKTTKSSQKNNVYGIIWPKENIINNKSFSF